MENQNQILMKEMPWAQLEKIGLTEEAFLDLPKGAIDRIMSGGTSPLMKLRFVDAEGNALRLREKASLSQGADGGIPTKFRLVRDTEGAVQLRIMPRMNEFSLRVGETALSPDDVRRMRDDMESVLMTVRRGGKDERCYVQLDHDLNVVHTVREQDVAIPNAIGDVILGETERQRVHEGRPVELEVGNTRVTVGVDLNARNGFRIVEGDMDLWRQRKLEQWDRVTPGVRGYWKTSENGWEYELHRTRQENLRTERTVERGSGRVLDASQDLDVSMRQSRSMRR